MNFKYLIKRTRALATFLAFLILSYIYVVLRVSYRDSTNKTSYLRKYIIDEDIAFNESINTSLLKPYLKKMNNKRKIFNLNKFGVVEDDVPIVVIQVHKDFKRLQYLIVSLSQVQGIQSTLLIFSHSFYHDSINRLVRSIDFCKVMQIFYPYSLQLHPNTFPGIDPDDCDPGTLETKRLFCLIRDARLTEHKQHWWWKANFIFKRIKFHKQRSPILFLEEDNYVAPDLLYMFQYVHRSLEYLPYVEVMSMGKPLTNTLEMHLLTVESWRPPYDIGMAFNRTTWKKILKAADHFCFYNDNNWSYSLLNLFSKFKKGHVEMVGCIVPRVFSTKEFAVADILETYSKLFKTLNFFPKKVHSVSLYGPRGRVERVTRGPPKGSGGWSDIRDQLLCLDPLISTTTNEKRHQTSS